MANAAETSRYDEEVKEAIKSAVVSDERIVDLFQKFAPSYTLDYTAPARLGLAAYISSRRPELLARVFHSVAQDYFALGVTSDLQFRKVLDWAVGEQRHILSRHGDAGAPDWLQQNFERYREHLGQKLADLEREFQDEQHKT